MSEGSAPSSPSMGMLSRLFSFGSLGSGGGTPTQEAPTPTPAPTPQHYYGVYIPCPSEGTSMSASMLDEDSGDFKTLHVYTDRVEALKIVKKYKKARFKALNTRQEAVAFALRGAEPERGTNVSLDGPYGVVEAPPNLGQIPGGEKPSQFRGPRPQEMVQFRKLIEAGDLVAVKNIVWENPRYLVSSGDTPSILQEGSRYNALHYAVKTNSLEMCDLLLSTISDSHFMQLLFADDNLENNKDRAAVLLDLYLNMPDKAMNETPLHFATKFGFKEIVDLLVSYPQCTRNVVNKFGDQPKDVICSRAKSSSPSLIKEIGVMLRDRFYVPVLHSEDGSQQPIIGDPFSPTTPPVYDGSIPRDPMSPRIEIRALAGPMEKGEAEIFRKRWKTPPRAPRPRPLAEPKFRLQDVHKGLEKVGRDLAQKMKVGWREYWPFLDTFTDLTSEEGFTLLEDYLKNKYVSQWNNSSNSVILPDSFHITPKAPLEKNVPKSGISFSLLNKQQNQSNESNALSPMSDLCMALKSCNLNDDSRVSRFYEHKETKPQLNNYEYNKLDKSPNLFLNPGLNPYSYVEKTCLVFAKRITTGLIRALATEMDMVVECLKSETKHLQQTVVSYMDDPRFCTVDFHLIHSRVGQLIAHKLYSELPYNDDIDMLKQSLKDATVAQEKSDVLYSSDEEESVMMYRINTTEERCIEKIKKKSDSHVCCLAGNILKWLSDNKSKENVKSVQCEEECIQVWGELYKCHCAWQTEPFMRNHRRNTSMKRLGRENSDLSTSPKTGMDIVSRRLKFESEDRGLNDIFALSPPKGDRNHNLSNSVHYQLSSSPTTEKKPDVRRNLTGVNGNSFELNQVEADLISEEGSDVDEDNEVFLTPVSSGTPEFLSSDESDYEEADNGQKVLAEPSAIDVFILGECPSKMDKAVYEAIVESKVDRDRYPYVYRWRHNIGLYPHVERNSWPEKNLIMDEENSSIEEECITPVKVMLHLGHIRSKFSLQTSTPMKPSVQQPPLMPSTPPLQVSKWMRVTGPNTPRSAINNNNFRPNVSFGF